MGNRASSSATAKLSWSGDDESMASYCNHTLPPAPASKKQLDSYLESSAESIDLDAPSMAGGSYRNFTQL